MSTRPLALLLVTVLGCGHAASEPPVASRSSETMSPSESAETTADVAPATAPPGADPLTADPAEATSPTAAANALYLGAMYGPIVRIADDGTVAQLGEPGSTTDFAIDPAGVVYAASRGRIVAVVGDVLEPLGSLEEPITLTMVAARARDDVFAASSAQLAHFDGTSWTLLADARFRSDPIVDLAFDASGALWVLTQATLYARRGEELVELAPMAGSSVFSSFVRNAEGGLDLLHFRGIDHHDGTSWSMVPIDWVERSRGGRMVSNSLRAAAYADGVLALAAHRDAELALRAREVQYVGSSSMGRFQLPATELHDVSVDGRGRAWFATNGGLLLLQRYGDPRVDRWWPIHGFVGLGRGTRVVFATGRGPSTLPALLPPVASTVRGRLGARYAGARVVLCGEVEHSGGRYQCSTLAPRWDGAADARGRFTIEGVLPAGYEVLVQSGGRWLTTTARCCAPFAPGGEVDLDQVDVLR